MVIPKLAISEFIHHKTRVVLTVLAIALSVSLVVAVTSGYSSIEASVFRYFTKYMGSTDVDITRTGEHKGGISEKIVEELKRDPNVYTVNGRLETTVKPVNLKGEAVGEAELLNASIVGVKLPDDLEVALLRMETGTTGGWFGADDTDVAVVDQGAAKILQATPGSYILLPSPTKQLKLKVVGIVHKPGLMATFRPTIYIPLRTLQKFMDLDGKVTKILIALKPGSKDEAFVAQWRSKLAQIDPLAKLKSARDRRKRIETELQSIQFLSYLGGTISMLAATFIVFSTLSMGVTERQRMLAMLRAIGTHRRQIAGLVVFEGLLLASSGVIVGVPLGVLWIKILAAWKSEYFSAGAVLSHGGILFGSLGSLLTALLASILPAWTAMRLDPVEGMTAAGQLPRARTPILAAIAGLILVSVDPFLIFFPGLSGDLRFYGHFALGLPSLMVGGFLISPVFVWLVEKALGRIIAALFGVRYKLLAQQLSGNLWRAAGTATALSVGLAVLVVMQTQGNTMLNGWKLPSVFPDMFIFSMGQFNDQQAKAIEQVPGIKKGELLPMAIEICRLSDGFFSKAFAAGRALAFMPDSTMFIGVEPALALKMMELEFRVGTKEEAIVKMRQGRHLIVTEEFRQLKGITVGSKIKLQTPVNGEVEYEVAGVVWSPGIDVFVNQFDMGMQFEERSAATVFGSFEDAKRDFGTDRVILLAANLEGGIARGDLEKQVRQSLGRMGVDAFDARETKFLIDQGFRRLLALLSTVALAAIGVASLGVANTIIASVRTRRWQLGILRSIGVTRLQMLRLILAEVVLLSLVASALGVAGGLLMFADAHGLSMKVLGYNPPIDVPWDMVWIGVGIIIAVGLLAGAWPAIRASREEPLALLSAGRAAT